MKCLIAVLLLLIGGLFEKVRAQQAVKVPEVASSPILIDGNFAPDEWRGATVVKVTDAVTLYFKQVQGHVFIGVKADTPYPPYVDMFLLTESQELYNLHASMQIGERRLSGNAWTDGQPAWRWGNHVGWIANEAKYDSTKDRSLPDKEKVFPYEGKEFQLLRSRFTGKQWRLRIEVRGASSDIVFPSGSERMNTTGWATIQL
jgi:hypothetical protein